MLKAKFKKFLGKIADKKLQELGFVKSGEYRYIVRYFPPIDMEAGDLPGDFPMVVLYLDCQDNSEEPFNPKWKFGANFHVEAEALGAFHLKLYSKE